MYLRRRKSRCNEVKWFPQNNDPHFLYFSVKYWLPLKHNDPIDDIMTGGS